MPCPISIVYACLGTEKQILKMLWLADQRNSCFGIGGVN